MLARSMSFEVTLYSIIILKALPQAFSAMVCPFLSSPDNGFVILVNGNTVDSVATYGCDLGLIDNSKARVCQSNGQWSGNDPQCTVGQPPSFVVEPMDSVVHSSLLRSTGTLSANLILSCNATGTPTPAITWYREDVKLTNEAVSYGSSILALNVSEGFDATRSGLFYHCEATNIIGYNDPNTATIRSRDANVSYAFFEVGNNFTIVEVEVKVVPDDLVALECDIPPSNPPPQIQWNDDFGLVQNSSISYVHFFDRGKFLYISRLTETRLQRKYYCSLTYMITGDTYDSPIRYVLSGGGVMNGMLIVYKMIGKLSGLSGESISIVYAAGYRKSNVFGVDGAFLICQHPEIVFTSVGGEKILYIMIPQPMGNKTELNISCYLQTADGVLSTITTPLNIIVPARITFPTSGSILIDRKNYQGQDVGKTFKCLAEGNPQPSLSWYYNGDPIKGVNGVIERGTELVIPSPQPIHSGIYQCLVRNTFNETRYVDQRTWFLEIRLPRPTYIEPFLTTNTLAVADDQLGILLVTPDSINDLVILAVVSIEPCASVQWTFNGTNIPRSDFLVTLNDPCTDNVFSRTYTYKLTIPPSTQLSNSGFYSAKLDNGVVEPAILPKVFVTIPVAARLVDLTLTVENEPYTSCMLVDSDIILTCEIIGYPRPTVTFRKNNIEIGSTPSFGIIRIDLYQLKISSVTIKDGGSYSCQESSENELFKNFSSCTKPVITDSTGPDNVMGGQTLELACVTVGIPVPILTWKKDGVLLTKNDNVIFTTGESGRHVLTIISTTKEDSGTYTCSASNLAATVNSSMIIEVIIVKLPAVTQPANIKMIRDSMLTAISSLSLAVFSVIIGLIILAVYFKCCRIREEMIVPPRYPRPILRSVEIEDSEIMEDETKELAIKRTEQKISIEASEDEFIEIDVETEEFLTELTQDEARKFAQIIETEEFLVEDESREFFEIIEDETKEFLIEDESLEFFETIRDQINRQDIEIIEAETKEFLIEDESLEFFETIRDQINRQDIDEIDIDDQLNDEFATV